MFNANKKIDIIDTIGLLSIGVFSLGYVFLKVNFAELHIQFRFLNFPIFVGEILIFICTVLLIKKYKISPWKITIWDRFVIAYFVFVLIKTAIGYIGINVQWQPFIVTILGPRPLALRHAALFYYPIFIIFGYYFYRRDFFDRKKTVVISLIIVGMFVIYRLVVYKFLNYEMFNEWWLFTSFILTTILVWHNLEGKSKYIMLSLLLIITPYPFLYIASRMMILSNTIAIVYTVICLYVLIHLSRKVKMFIAAIACLLLLCVMIGLSSNYRISSIFAVSKISERFRWFDELVDAQKNTYSMAELKDVRLYNSDIEPLDKKDVEVSVKMDVESLMTETNVWQVCRDVVYDKSEAGNNIRSNNDFRKAFVLLGKVCGNVKDDPDKAGVDFIALREEFEEAYNKLKLINLSGNLEKEDREVFIKILRLYKLLETKYIYFDESPAYSNVIFRLFIWRDMMRELISEKPLLGMDFGKPLRSISLEIIGLGYGEWMRDGWIAAHNSYLNIIYRAGAVGIIFILAIIIVWLRMVSGFVKIKSVTGVLLTAAILNWFVAANFLLIFELPYTAIPIWTLYGMALAYYHSKVNKINPSKRTEVADG